MARVHKIKVEQLTEEAFQTFGQIIGPQSRPPNFQGMSGSKLWALDFQMGGRLQFAFTWAPYLGLTFKMMEQHYGVTQSFIPMSGPPSVVAVAPPTKRGIIPKPEDFRAFLLDGTRGYVLHKSTWHSLDRFPLYPPGGDFTILTDWETTEDLLASPDLKGSKLTKTVDFEEELGVTFEFVL